MIDVNRLLAETGIRQIEWHEQTDSTNDRAMSLSRDPRLPTPYLIGADRQDAGRGRGGNPWWGADGALLFSVVVDMPGLGLSSMAWPRFSLTTGLAVSETLSMFLQRDRVGLKWPNDVWLNGRKVCGILIEQADRCPERFVVGIGLNVNNSFGDAPEERKRIATSMIDEADGCAFSPTDVLIEFLKRWMSLVDDLAGGRLQLVDRWSHLCVLTGHPIAVTSSDRETTGICGGIDDDGSLLLRTSFTTERCYAGTVRLLG